MCFFEQERFVCGDFKWTQFKQQCDKEFRTGETCGMKLVMKTNYLSDKCRLCQKIDTKKRRRAAELERVTRWRKEGGRFSASIDKATEIIRSLDREIVDLGNERARKQKDM